MATHYHRDDAVGLGRDGYGGASYKPYNARQAAQARQYASGALPFIEAQSPSDPILRASSSTLDRDFRRSQVRCQSISPPTRRRSRRNHHRSLSRSSQDDSRGNEDPIRKAHALVNGTFSSSTSGLGVGVLGAIVGGLVAREASESAKQRKRHGHRRRSYHDQDRTRLLSTVLGVAVGGLGANAIEKRLENSRDKTAEKQEAWLEKWQRDSRGRIIGNNLNVDRGKRKSQRGSGDSGEAHAR